MIKDEVCPDRSGGWPLTSNITQSFGSTPRLYIWLGLGLEVRVTKTAQAQLG